MKNLATSMTSILLAGLVLGACSQAHQSPSGQDDSLARLSASLPPVGEPLPAIEGVTLDGRTLGNDDLAGRTALINLWFYH